MGIFSYTKSIFLIGSVLLAGVCAGQQAERPNPQRMWALVIGISRYAHAEPLQFAASDAQSIRDFLTSPRGGGMSPEHVFMLLEDQATRKSVEVELEAMQGRVKNGDTVYVFIAGHGHLTNRGIGYFIPSDGDVRVPASTSISFAALKELIELGLGNAGRRILLTDLCHAGRIGPGTSELAEKIQNLINAELLKAAQGAPGTCLNLLSSHPLEQSWESGKLKSGVFSYTLLEALNGKAALPGSSVVRARELVAYLRSEVPRGTGGRQTPMANEDFDSRLPLAFLNLPAIQPDSPTPARTASGATLTILNTDQTSFVRVQWIDPQTQAVAVRLIQWHASRIQIGSLTPGEFELLFFDSENRSRKVLVSLKPGTNTLDLAANRAGRNLYQPRGQFRLAAFSHNLPMRDLTIQEAVEETGEEAALLLRLDAGTQVFIDGDFFGMSPGTDRFLLLQALPPGSHNLSLIPSAEREHRFRVKLFRGRQIFDAQTGELRAVLGVQPPPDFLPVPSVLPPAQEDIYRKFAQALWEEKLVEPVGRSAADYFEQLRAGAPDELLSLLKNRLAIAMGDKAQRIILKYLRGGDIRWSAAAFDEGAALVHRVQSLHKSSDSLRSQETFFRGRSMIERSRHPEAIRELQQALKLDPLASHAMNALGLAFWKQNLLDQAIAPLEQAISLSPAWTYPRNTLGLVYLEQRRYQKAAQCFQSSIELNAEDSMAFHCLGQLQLLLGHLDEAENLLLQALEVNPGNAYACETFGKLCQRRQQWDKAERMFRLAIRLEPEELSFHISLAELLQRAGQSGTARSLFNELLKRSSANAPILLAYAAFLTTQKQFAEADKALRQAGELVPNDPNTHVRYGIFLEQQGRTDAAVRQFRRAIQIAPGNPYAHHNLAVAYLSQKKLPEAEKELADAMKADPRYPAPPLLLGDLRLAQKRFSDALKEYGSALSLSTEANQQDEIKEKIRQAEAAVVKERIGDASKKAESREYGAAWLLLADGLKTHPDHRELRDAILAFQADNPSSADLTILPVSGLKAILSTTFWRQQHSAECFWRRGQKAQAFETIQAAVRSMKPEERPLVLSVYLNLGNELHGIHNRISRWALRFVEARDYDGALRLLDEAARQNIFGVVPAFSPLTIDSLMVPPDHPQLRRFSDFEVAHHPDRRVHVAYAAAHAGKGDLGEVRLYLAALEAAKPDLAACLAVAKAFYQERNWRGALSMLKDALDPVALASQKDLAPEALVLMADTQCRWGDCAAGRNTLKTGLKLFPDNRSIQDAMRRFKSSSRSSP